MITKLRIAALALVLGMICAGLAVVVNTVRFAKL